MWKFAVAALCVAAIYGAAITWQRYKVHANEMKLAENARTCRARAEQGDAAAQADLAEMYYHGEGVQQDYSEALRWYRRAGDHGNAKGQYGVGLIYYHGKGVTLDLGEALRWYRKSADQGYAKAECGIGLIYSQGQGVQQDYTEAIRWYRKAVDQGYAPAEYNLGNMYYYGRGVPKDRAEAARWYHKAADQGDEYAQRVLGLREAGLSNLRIITLAGMFLGCVWVLKDPFLQERSDPHRREPALTAAGILGLTWVGLNLYRAFAVFQSVLSANVLSFAEGLVAGVGVAMLISIFRLKTVKIALGVSVALLLLNCVIVIRLHALRLFVITGVRGFSSVNGLLLGIAVPLAIFLWLQTNKTGEHGEVAG